MDKLTLGSPVLLYFLCVLSGFALIKVDLTGTFLESLGRFVNVVGVIAVLVFALFILFIGVKALFGKD